MLKNSEMELTQEIQIINLGLYIKKHKTLIISDLHLGYENAMELKGVLLPRFQLKDILKSLEKIFSKVEIEQIVINGDLKHEFGKILKQEWKDILQFFDYLFSKCKKIIVVKGNHDVVLSPIAGKRNIQIVKEVILDDILIIHGDSEPKLSDKIKTIIIGHEHPAISIRDGERTEKFKCFLKGKYENLILIIQPSFNPLIEGTDITKQKILSPLIKNVLNFEAFVFDGEKVLKFGKVKNFMQTL